MTASFQALLADALDYAGLYPPAQLPLATAARAYAADQAGTEAWMLARFVCPVARLDELAGCGTGSERNPLRVSVTGRRAETTWEYIPQLVADLRSLSNVPVRSQRIGYCGLSNYDFPNPLPASRRLPNLVIECFETCLPLDAVAAPSEREIQKVVAEIGRAVSETGTQPLRVFFEVPQVSQWQDAVRKLIGVLAVARESVSTSCALLGFKLRVGGLGEGRSATSKDVAFVIHACRDARLAWKATAGLHHPLPAIDPVTRARSHGLLNVLAATMLAEAYPVAEELTRRVLDDNNPANFVFHDEAFGWRDMKVTTPQIRYARQHRLLSIGSCSFTEPCEGFRELGLLEPCAA